MDVSLTALTATRLDPTARPFWLGLAMGTVLPVIAGILFATYDLAARPIVVQNAQLWGYVYLAGEIALILHAQARGLDVWSIARALPRWAQVALTVFLTTFWISSVTVSRLPSCSIMLCLAWTIHLLFAAGLFHLMRDVPQVALARFWPGFVVGLVSLTLMIVIHFTFLPAWLVGHERSVDWKVAIPGFINVRLFGSWTGAVFAALLGLAWLSPGRGPAAHRLYAAAAFAFALTFWTTTRAALLADLCVLPIAWFVAGAPRARAFWSILPLYLLAGALLTLPFQPYHDPSYTFFEANNFTSVDGFATGRLSYWSALLRLALDHPLLGSGMMASWWLLPPFYIHPHNVVVEFLLNWGIVGGAAAGSLLAGAAWHAHQAAARASALLPVVLMVDVSAIEGLFDGMFHFAQFVMLILGGLAICLAGARGVVAD